MQLYDELVNLRGQAEHARRHAYAPYSQFSVGAAVLSDDGRVFIGCNVENASYGLTICAERVAVTSAIAAGARHVRAVAVVGPADVATPPCGACRQVLAEFAAPDVPITYHAAGGWITTTMGALLPETFELP
jgi:cytidine deaminase